MRKIGLFIFIIVATPGWAQEAKLVLSPTFSHGIGIYMAEDSYRDFDLPMDEKAVREIDALVPPYLAACKDSPGQLLGALDIIARLPSDPRWFPQTLAAAENLWLRPAYSANAYNSLTMLFMEQIDNGGIRTPMALEFVTGILRSSPNPDVQITAVGRIAMLLQPPSGGGSWGETSGRGIEAEDLAARTDFPAESIEKALEEMDSFRVREEARLSDSNQPRTLLDKAMKKLRFTAVKEGTSFEKALGRPDVERGADPAAKGRINPEEIGRAGIKGAKTR